MEFKEVDITELELGQVCYDTAGTNQTIFVFCGTGKKKAWFYPVKNIGSYSSFIKKDGTMTFPKTDDSWYEEV